MAKKKEKPQVINNIKELNLEIDYDKLAEAIVKAQNKAEETTVEEKTQKKKVNIFKAIFDIIFNRNKTNGKFLPEAMSELICFMFNALVGITLGFSGAMLSSAIYTVSKFFKGEFVALECITIVLICLILTVIGVMLSLLMRAVANDIKNERDKHYLLSIISTITGFIAMIVALVALFKGVG